MREIKFRGFNGKEMVFFELFSKPWPWSNENPVMQFTGLKDKNGKEIYEGDIMEFPWDEKQTCKGTVEFGDGWFDIHLQEGAEWPDHHTPINDGEGEVIGNIYENPDLLK
jgi:uncharacterized phage protein (TIGR01671 family)